MSWAFARLNFVHTPLCAALSSEAIKRIKDATSQEIANLAWAFSRREIVDMPLFAAISASSIPTIQEIDRQSMANPAWAWSHFHLLDTPLLDAIAASSIRTMSDFNAQDLSNSAWAFSRRAVLVEPLWQSISAASRSKISSLGSQGLSSPAWAFSRLDVRDGPLFSAISAAAIAPISDFGDQSLSLLAWALATLQLNDETLLQAISSQVIRRIQAFSPQHLSNTAWAFAKLLVWHSTLFQSIAASAIALIHYCDPQSHANLVWAFASLGRIHLPLMEAISAESIARIRDYEPQELSNIVWSFASLKLKDSPLCAAIAAQSLPRITQFASLNISNTVWAFGVASETARLGTFLPPATAHFLRLADASVGTEWVDFVSAVRKHAPFLPERAELIERFEHLFFYPVVEQLAMIVDPDKHQSLAMQNFKAFLDMRQLPHLGPCYTRPALSILGWRPPVPDGDLWVPDARHKVWAAQGTSLAPLVKTERIYAWLSASLAFHDQLVEMPGRLYQAGVPAEIDDDVCAMLRPTFRHVARDDHAERAALLSVLLTALDAFRAGTRALGELAGAVRLYVSHYPCISCLAVLGQFARLVPGPSLDVAFDDAWEDD